jgi:hypothetical protein
MTNTFGVFKVSTRPLWGESTSVNKLAGFFKQEDFAEALVMGLHQEQMQKLGTILDEYEVRPLTLEEMLEAWRD